VKSVQQPLSLRLALPESTRSNGTRCQCALNLLAQVPSQLAISVELLAATSQEAQCECTLTSANSQRRTTGRKHQRARRDPASNAAAHL